MALLEVKDLRTSFHTDDGVVKAVEGVSFSIEKGQTLGIVGESGSGKSVTCLTIMGLNPARNTVSSGQAVWKGDLDLITDSDEGPIWYENTGSQARPVMTLRGRILKEKISGHNPTPVAANWNGDGRLDLLVGAEDGFFYYFERSYIEAQR